MLQSDGMNGKDNRLSVMDKQIQSFCERHKIRKLSLFGSVLRDDFGPESDIDVLVEFEPGHVPGFAFFSIQDELSELLGRQVDLNTLGFLSPYMRDDIASEAQDYYVKA